MFREEARSQEPEARIRISRRDLILRISAGLAVVTGADAQQVHDAVMQAKGAANGPYKPKALTAHEYATLQRLSDLIIPADEHSKGALEAGAADFIDYLCSVSDEMRDIYSGGIAWLDQAMLHRDAKDFVSASPEQQTKMLDAIAYRKNESPELGAGIQFFAFCRRMVADGYYTSPIGMKDVGYMGNKAVAEFKVPEEAVNYVMKRSPLG